MPNYFITFRAHSGEPQVFEDWMILLLKIIKKRKEFAYQVEWDETPSRHIHLLLYDIAEIGRIDSDTKKCFFNNKYEKLFKEHLKTKLTTWHSDDDNKGFCNIIRCDDKDPLKSTDYYLGYIHKHNCSRRGHSDNITSEQIHDAVMLYYTTKKLSKREEKNNDIKLITSKNIYSYLISFVNDDQNETSFADKSLKVKTIYNGHFGYANISDNAEAKAFTELRIMNNCPEINDKRNATNSARNKKDLEQEHWICSQCEEENFNFDKNVKASMYNDMERLILSIQNPNEEQKFIIDNIVKKYEIYIPPLVNK